MTCTGTGLSMPWPRDSRNEAHSVPLFVKSAPLLSSLISCPPFLSFPPALKTFSFAVGKDDRNSNVSTVSALYCGTVGLWAVGGESMMMAASNSNSQAGIVYTQPVDN